MSPPLRILDPAWRALVERAGSVTALAKAFGVTPRTLHRWIGGDVTPSPIVQTHVNAWASRHRLAPPFRLAA